MSERRRFYNTELRAVPRPLPALPRSSNHEVTTGNPPVYGVAKLFLIPPFGKTGKIEVSERPFYLNSTSCASPL
jgi:hypothetical protein